MTTGRSVPPSAPTAFRPYEPAPDSARTYVHGHPRLGSNPPMPVATPRPKIQSMTKQSPQPQPSMTPPMYPPYRHTPQPQPQQPSHHAQTYAHPHPPVQQQQPMQQQQAMYPQQPMHPQPPRHYPPVQHAHYPSPPPMQRATPLPMPPQHVLPQPAHQPAPPSAKKPESKKEKKKPAVVASGDPQLGFRFKLTFGDGHIENMLVDAERALIGSAGHCEVRLPPEIVAHEHVEVYAHEGAVHFATKPNARDNLPTLDGDATMEGTWGTGSTLRIGDIAMTVELVSLGMAKAKPPIWALFVAIPAIALTAVGIALARPVDRGLPPVPEAPVLVGAKDGKCPDVAADQKMPLATEKLRIALAKRERSPFAPQEGYEAVLLFETAAACFRASGDAEQAKDADDAADVLRVKLDEDYRVRRVRLEHAYRTHQVNAAKRELNVLIPMTAHRKGPYTEWLAAVDRAATLEINNQGKLQP